ncbi:endoglucanase [Peteryoungia aggregata LMG 23059]|uniref:Endoglucanase n=1 Tax=Peteryoungia aggregata LMG 23059 TaxID=1368425 RepID=A0ABU0GDI3_9HYPH|nr:glycoside hydrolase family 5 protein [Peteryoungia aggregata]MDQ0423416.1 endoglucanase [Peteryoungia aggregata LMG 23059]
MQFRKQPFIGRCRLTSLIRASGFALALLATSSQPVLAAGACLRGVNLAGAEFGEEDGVFGTAYIYPSDETIAYFAGKGFNSVRLPFSWSRLQTSLNAEFDQAEFDRLKDTVRRLRETGLTVVLDPHNYARYRGELIGSDAVPYDAFARFWTELSLAFANQDGVVFGLMNEPHTMPTEQWLTGVNVAIAAIRATGARNLILVPGNSWSGAHSWLGEDYGGANGVVMLGVKDPLNHYAFEVHQYFDDDFSGTKDNCSRAVDAVAAIEGYTRWLRENGKRGYLGEFGVPKDEACIQALERMVSVVEQGRDVWIGWAYWAGGDWWPEEESLNIQPTASGDRPQLRGLTRALQDFSPAASTCPALGP